MTMKSRTWLMSAVAGSLTLLSIGLVATANAQDAAKSIDNNAGVFIDGKTFQIVPGKPVADAAARIKSLGARALGPGAIVFRSGDQLYIVDVPLRVQSGGPAAGQDVYVTADEPQSKPISIEYLPPKNPEHQQIYDLVKERHTLEMVQQIFSVFILPVELKIETVGCDGVSNAWYQREGKRPTVRICYEYLQELWQGMPKETTPAGITPRDALVGQFLFAVSHELGHAMFDIFDVPVFGRQEDAADQFAAYLMLQFSGDRAHRFVEGAAYSYREFIKDYKQKPKVTMPLAAFSSDHGSPEERFYNLLCTAYGYDAKVFADVVEKEYLPKTRAKNCKFEYEDLTYAFHQVIRPHVDQEKVKKVLGTTWLPSSSSIRPPR